MKRILVSVLVSLAMALPVAAAVYKWTDESGVVHFSDEPHPGAERLEVGQPPVYSAPPVSFQPAPQASSTVNGYTKFSIVQPQPEATVRNNPGTVTVRFTIEPALRPGDHIRVLLDGEAVASDSLTAGTLELHGIYRGMHTLSAVIEDNTGAVLARAGPVTFYMHRPSVHIPVNKPSG